MAIRQSLSFSPYGALQKAWNVLLSNWHLGFTAFGGPPVHFKIFHDKFVDRLGWVDEQIVSFFSICFSVFLSFFGVGGNGS